MNGFDEIVCEGFDARQRAIAEAGGVPRKRARSVVHAIHRRRVMRAVTAAGASVLAVGALALGAVNLAPSGKVTPGGFPLPTGGAYPWCDLTSYPAVNPAALGAYPYEGRIYVNEADGEFVYVAPDGVKTVLEPDADGNYVATLPTGERFMAPTGLAAGGSPPHMVWDLGADGSGGGRAYLWSHMAWDLGMNGSNGGQPYFVTPDERPYSTAASPGLLYEWTTTTSGDAPAGVSAAGILYLQLQSIGFSSPTSVTTFVPTGAALERVLRWSDGREGVTPLNGPQEQPVQLVEGDDLVGLLSVSLRVVGLPDGESYEVTSTYAPTKTWASACGTNLNLGSPALEERAFNWGP